MDFLNRLVSRGLKPDPSIASIRELFDELNPSLADLLPWITDPDGYPYGRKMLHVNAVFECILMNWAPNYPCAPHDHGPQSQGIVKILRGVSKHTIYHRDTNGLRVNSVTIHKAPELLEVVPMMLHSMESVGTEPMVSLHVYSPPIHDMKVFDSVTKSVLTVSDQCGAWVPKDQSLIKSRSAL